MYKVEYFDEIESDLDLLPDDVYDEAVEYFKRYKADPYACSQPLDELDGIDLRNYRKTYVAKATYRIVIRINSGKISIVNIVAVGKRQDKEVYLTAFKRISKK
jgi:mRNA interferase RelE/StbE